MKKKIHLILPVLVLVFSLNAAENEEDFFGAQEKPEAPKAPESGESKIKLPKSEGEKESLPVKETAPEVNKPDADKPETVKPELTKEPVKEPEKEPVKPADQPEVVAEKKIEIKPAAKTEAAPKPFALSLGATVSLMNTAGEIHRYLDTAVGFGLFAQTQPLFDDLPFVIFAQAGYFNASSYRVQSMSFIYVQAGAGWPIDLFMNIKATPYVSAGIHTGRFSSAYGDIGTSFLLPSFDLGALISYPITREIGAVFKGGFMPVLDKVVSSNFWHVGLGVTYAL